MARTPTQKRKPGLVERGLAVEQKKGWLFKKTVLRSANPKVTELLIHFRNKDVGVRRRAIEALGRVNNPAAVPTLADAVIHDRNAGIRLWSAWALAMIKDPKATPALTRCLKEEPDPWIKNMAIWALSEIGAKETIPIIEKVVAETTDEVAKSEMLPSLKKLKGK